MTEKKETKTKGDVNAEFNQTCSWVSNPISIIKQNPFIFSEQPKEVFIGEVGKGAFSNLKGLHKTNAKMQMVLKMIAGKGNNLTETFGEDIQENTYAFRIAEAVAHLDAQIGEEEEMTGVRPERLNWSYASKSHMFGNSLGCSEKRFENENYTSEEDRFKKVYIIQTPNMGCTDERVKKHCEEMPVEEKAERVVSVQRFDGEMDVAGQRTHFRHNHWINGEFIEEHSDVQVTVNRPVMPLPTPVMKATEKFPIAGIEGYEEGIPVFGAPNMMIHTLSMRVGRHGSRDVKVGKDIETLKTFLTAEPQFASEIAGKAGMSVIKVSKLLKTAMNAGELKMVNKMNADSKKRPAFFI